MFGKSKKRIAELEAKNTALEKENAALKAENAELSKKTVSQRTTQEEQAPSFAQIMDEWINGAKEEGNG